MDLKAVGRRIKSARERNHLTQERLAELVDLSPMHISVIERGLKSPKLDTFVKIANALNVSTEELLQDIVEQSPESNESELSDLLRSLPSHEQQKLLYTIKAYVHFCSLTEP